MGSKGEVFSSFCVKCYLYIVYYVLFCTEKWIVSLLSLHEMAKSNSLSLLCIKSALY